MTEQSLMPVKLRAGDQFVVHCRSVLGRAISWGEKKDAEADPAYGHAGIIIDWTGTTIEALETIRYGHLSDYTGQHVLIGRYGELNPIRLQTAIIKIGKRLGQWYPWWRLPLSLASLARVIDDGRVVCSELAAQMWWLCTGFKEFEDYRGWTPAELADVYEHWKEFEIVFKGIWTTKLTGKE